MRYDFKNAYQDIGEKRRVQSLITNVFKIQRMQWKCLGRKGTTSLWWEDGSLNVCALVL